MLLMLTCLVLSMLNCVERGLRPVVMEEWRCMAQRFLV